MRNFIYLPAPFVQLRIPVLTAQDLEKLMSNEGNWIELILSFFSKDAFIRDAILYATPSLYNQLNAIEPEKRYEHADSLYNYLVRMATRSTPFGLFSFVSLCRWGDVTRCNVNLNLLKKNVRPDMEWLYKIIYQQANEGDNFSRLTLYTNPLLKVFDKKIVLDYIYSVSNSHKDKTTEISVNRNPLVDAVVRLAKEPLVIMDLIGQLMKSFPQLKDKDSDVHLVIKKLLDKQILLPDAFPRLIGSDDALSAGKHIPADMSNKIKSYALTSTKEKKNAACSLLDIHHEMRQLQDSKTPLHIDLTYFNENHCLSKKIHDEVRNTVQLMWDIMPKKNFHPQLKKYHEKFMEKYGVNRLVPLMDVISSLKGIGAYVNSELVKLVKDDYLLRWEQLLSDMWHEALINNKTEIELNKQMIESLKPFNKRLSHKALPSFDIFCQILSDGAEAIDKGDFLISMDQIGWQGAASFGRFMHFFNSKAQSTVKQFLADEEMLEPNTDFLEMSWRPRFVRNANVAAHPPTRKLRINLDSPSLRDNSELGLEDIYIGAINDRLFLSLKDGDGELHATTMSMLNVAQSPMPIQLMRDITLSRYALPQLFSWGKITEFAVFLPRVRYKKTILSPAMWILRVKSFPKKRADIEVAFKKWAEKWKLPTRFLLVYQDYKLLIDTTHPASMKNIVKHIKKGSALFLIEANHQTWLKSNKGCHSSEVVISLQRNPSYMSTNKMMKPEPYAEIAIHDRLKLLGGSWVYVKLYLPLEEINCFLQKNIVPLMKNILDENIIEKWFFIRYEDPLPHARIRMQVTHKQALNDVLDKLQSCFYRWIQQGSIRSVMFDSYDRELERYGGLECIEQIESFFHSDSVACASLLAFFINNEKLIHRDIWPIIAIILFMQQAGFSIKEMQMFIDNGKKPFCSSKIIKNNIDDLLSIISDMRCEEPKFDINNRLNNLTIARQAAFKALIATMKKHLSIEKSNDVIASLLHMTCNRLGLSNTLEKQSYMDVCYLLNKLTGQQFPVN